MSFLQHVWDLLLLFGIVISPIPCCLWVATVTNHKSTLSFAHDCLVVLVTWCCLGTAIVLLLGAIQALNLSCIVIAAILIALAGLILLRTAPDRSNRASFEQVEWQEFVIAGAFLCVFLKVLIQAVLTPITNYDSLAYHLPAMVKWYQTGSFTIVEQFKFELIGYYPYNWEALCSLFIFPLREDLLVTLPNFVAWIMLGLAIYLISRSISAQRIHSLAASFLVLMLPILIRFINSIHVDLPFAAFFMSAFYFLLLWWERRSLSDVVLVLLSIAMMLGIKTSGIPYTAFLIFAMLLYSIVRPKPDLPWIDRTLNRSQGFAIFGTSIALFIGGFWYVKNLLLTGNPFGVLEIKLFGIQLFSGIFDVNAIRQTTLASLFNWLNREHWMVVIEQLKIEFGLPLFELILPILLVMLMLLLRLRNLKKPMRLMLLWLSVLSIGGGVLYVYTPYSGANEPPLNAWMGQGLRYALPGISLLAVLSAISSSLIGLRKEWVTAACVLTGLIVLLGGWGA